MDKILRAAVFGGTVSAAVLETTQLVNKAIDTHKLSPTAAAALGRTLTGAAYMCSGLKSEHDSLSVSIKGDGPCGHITVSGNAKLQMRGYIKNPSYDIKPNAKGKLDVSGIIGRGTMTVVKDLGLKMPYTGAIELVSGEIAEDFAEYFLKSEQTPCAVALGVKIGTDLRCIGAGGLVLCPLPNCPEDSLKKAEALLPQLSAISTLIEEEGAEGVFKRFFANADYETFYPKYECTCSRSYIEKVIIALGEEEANDIIKTEGEISLHCHYCDTTYKFSAKETKELFKQSL